MQPFHTVNEATEPTFFRDLEIASPLPRSIRVALTPGVSCRRRVTAPMASAVPMKARRLTAARRSCAAGDFD
jgi:hypothetical protein